MNILIVGGLLALALVAIVGAVLLSMGEERLEKQRKAGGAAPIPEASQVADVTLPVDALPLAPAQELPAPEMETFVSAPAQEELSASEMETPAFTPAQELPADELETPIFAPSQAFPAAPLEVVPETPVSAPFGNFRTTRQLAPSLHENQHLSAYRSAPDVHREEDMAILNDQIRAISGELRSLVQKANELEQHLNTLSEVLERQQNSQNKATTKIRVPRLKGMD